MPIELNENDLAAIGTIQEAKSTTVARAKEYYRKAVAKLANPDLEDRHEIVLENFNRGTNGSSEDVFAEKDKPAKTKKAKTAKVAKAPKAAKKSKAAKKEPKPRIEVPLPELDREVELKTNGEPAVYTANLFGKKHAVVMAERNRERGADARFESIGVSERRLDAVTKYAKENELPVAIAAVVRIKGRLDQGYAIPLDVFKRFKGKSLAVNLSAEARAAYQENGWAGVKFSEAKAEAA